MTNSWKYSELSPQVPSVTPKCLFLDLQALPIVFLTNATLSILYYLGAMQFLISVIGSSLRFVLGTSAIEATGVAASIFMEGV